MSKKVVLGFSGGLDTSYCVKYFTLEKGYEVHSIIVNTGGFSEEELKKIEAHAYRQGPGEGEAYQPLGLDRYRNRSKQTAYTPLAWKE